MVVQPSSVLDPFWFPNSGATNHITNDLASLNLCGENTGNLEYIHVGNGADLVNYIEFVSVHKQKKKVEALNWGSKAHNGKMNTNRMENSKGHT